MCGIKSDSDYYTGNVVKDLEDLYVSESYFKIEDSKLSGTFLFDYFVENYKGN
jgi:hypothetical protein